MNQQLRTLAEAATPEMKEWFGLDDRGWCFAGEAFDANSAYIAALSPDVVIGLLDKVDALTAECVVQSNEASKQQHKAFKYMAENSRLTAERDELKAAAQVGLDALQWYIDEDEVIESMEGNEYWVEGKYKAETVVTQLRDALGVK